MVTGTTAPVHSLPTLDTAVFSLVLAGEWGVRGYGVGYGCGLFTHCSLLILP